MAYQLSQDALAYADAKREELTALLETLCGIPSPSHHEERRAEFCRKWLQDAGAKEVYVDSALNVVCPVNCEGKDQITVFMAHIDTVFPDMEPMELSRKDGKILCPGVGDDTANVAMLMMAAKYALERGFKPENGWLFVLNSCEEGLGNLKGCRQLMEDYKGRIKEVWSFDGTTAEICNGAVGSSRYRVTVRTEGGHSYAKFGNRNAIAVLAELIRMLYSVKVPTPGTTYNVGAISGGTSVNTIAQEAQMLWEYRSDSRESLAAMEKFFDSALETFRLSGASVDCEVLGRRPCMGDVDPQKQKALEEKALDLVKTYGGTDPKFKSSSTDCNIPFSLGIPAICFGGYVGQGAHTREEWILEESLAPGLKLVMASVLSCL